MIKEETIRDGVFVKRRRRASTPEDMAELFSQFVAAHNAEPERSLKWYEREAGEILATEGWPSTWCEELVTWGATREHPEPSREVSARARDAKEILATIRTIRIFLAAEDIVGVMTEAVRLGCALARVVIRPLESDVFLGRNFRARQTAFGKTKNTEVSKLRRAEHDRWREAVQSIARANPAIAASKSELARRVKRKLNLQESIETIRKRL